MADPLYVLGDIHGQLGLLETALDWIARDGGAAAPHVFVGDLVDRGPDSRGVIAFLMAAEAEGRDWTVLKGNHDRLFHQFWQTGSLNDGCLRADYTWLHPRMGAIETLASYGLDVEAHDPADLLDLTRDAVPEAHIDWLAARPIRHETETHFFAHAGIRPGVPLSHQTEDDLLWIRKEFHRDEGPHPKVIVHGHTPVEIPVNYGHRINTDGGAGYDRPIHPVVLEGGQVFQLSEAGRALM